LAITASGTTLTDTNNSFTADDVGDWVLIEGAGAAGVKLETRIASYTGVGEVEVEDAAATTVSSATGYWSTNEFSVTVTDNEFYQIGNAANPSSAIDIYQFAQNVIIKNNTIRKSPYGGIRVANSYNSTIEGNTVDGVIGTAGGGGIKIQGVTRANRAAAYLNHTIMGNVVLDWDATITEAFMIIGDGTNSVFQQNVLLADNIVKGGYGGVLLDGCENVELSGNIIDGITHTGSTTAGILIKRSPGPISIRGGWIRNCSTYGIYSGDSTNLVYSLHGINFQNNTFNHWRIAETDAIGVVDGCRHYGTPTQIGWEDTTQITVSNNTSPSSSTLNYGGSSVRHRWNNSIDLLSGSGTVDPASIPDGDEAAYDVTVTGATLGDYVLSCSFSIDVMDVVLSGQITSSNTVSVVFANNTGGAIDLGSGTLRVLVQKI
jgi:parallel beta-helix repeat protein